MTKPIEQPTFTLSAKDIGSIEAVELWASLQEAAGADKETVQKARETANQMRKWQAEVGLSVPFLD